MTKPEWGTKRKCLKCGASFYDMRKKNFTCPKCGETYDADELAVAKLQAALKSQSNVAALEKEMDEEEIVASVVGDVDFQDTDDSENLLEDASELEDDDNHDMSAMMDNVGGKGHDEE